ncbi:MAG: hypothetical protein WBH01_04305 [Dehalococcoidia bacterium]
MEITGIALQVSAGLVFILDQVAHRFSTSIESWIGRIVTFLTGKRERRLSIVVLSSLVALPVIIIALTTWGTEEGITWSVIVGVLVFTVLGFDVYALLLVLIGKRTLRGNIGAHISSLNENGKLVSVNVILLISSSILLSGFIYVVGHVLPKTDNIVLQALLLVPIFIILLAVVPTLLFSLFFLFLEGVFRLLHRMGNVRHPEYYWIAIAVFWVAGGGLLLASALRK